MGSKSPEGRKHESHGDTLNSHEFARVGGKPRGSHMSRDGDGCLGEDGDGGDDEGDGDGADLGLQARIVPASSEALNLHDTRNNSKKKKKPKKKSKASSLVKQSKPPRVQLSVLFPSGEFPVGEVQDYEVQNQEPARVSAAEIRWENQGQQKDEAFLQNYRKAAEVHREARQWIQETMKPGQSVKDIADGIEDSVRAMLGNAGLETGECRRSGMGFPSGICLNNQVAHYTPSPGQKDVILQQKDVVTIDFGVHINGWIVDSAFTTAFDPTYDNLLAAVRAATNGGIKAAGVDVRISDVSAAIQEIMESYEVDIDGKTYPVKAIRNLTGHNITQNHIHGGKSIPFVKNFDQTKMEEGEVFAIETFGSTGKARVYDDVGTYGYGLNHDMPLTSPLSLQSARRLHKTIRDNFGTIPFCRRYLDRLGVDRYLAGMNCLVSNGIVERYQPLMDIKGSYSAQFEHTIILHETHKEVLSRGDDY